MGIVCRAVLTAASCSAAMAWAMAASAAPSETLADAITLTYETNPTLQAQRASQRATDEEYVQARSGYRPTVTISGSVTRDDNEAGSSLFALPGATDTTNTSNGALTVTQPLYTGGRVATQIDAAKADILAGREGLRRTEIGVLESVIQAYLDVRRDQEQLAIAQDNVTVLKRQLEETNARFDVGEVTRTDTAQAQARLAAAQAQLASVQSALAIARAAYAEVVGQNPGDLAPEPPIAGLLPPTVDAAFDAAEQNNPQVLQANYTEQGSAARLAEAKAQVLPSASLRASLGYSGGGINPLTGKLVNQFSDYNRDLSVTASITAPLFTGGLTSSEIRQAAERNNVDRIGLETARRQVLQAVSQAWNQLLGARANLVADEQQVKADTIAYEGTRQEAQVGLRTTLDVLNAQQELETSELSLVGARHDEYLSAAAVLAAMGALEAKVLIPGEPRYDPKTNFDHVRHAIGWVPWESAVEAIDHIGTPTPIRRPPPSPPGEVVKP
ncbi:MAG: TolC family outer membrane protein [Caulobacterales bacterium]